MSNLNNLLNSKQVVAGELFSSGMCNLKCTYCYIPKTTFLKEINDEILRSIESGVFLNRLKEIYGNDLEIISHWGTEPTLTINKFKDFYRQALEVFPSLSQVNLSSNFITNYENLLNFITSDLPDKKPLTMEIQVSIDGPIEITDKNRGKGTTNKIISNLLSFTKRLNEIGTVHKIKCHIKPTIDSSDIKRLSDFKSCLEYYNFFENMFMRWKEANFNNLITIQNHCDPTIVFPGDYTKEDGQNFYKLVQNQIELSSYEWKYINKPESFYFHRFKDKLLYMREFFTKHKMFTCSAGDSNMGIGMTGNLHICHATYYMESDKYKEQTLKYGTYEPNLKAIEKGGVDIITKNYIANETNELPFLFKLRCFHDSALLQLSADIALTMELAIINEINECYKNPRLAQLLSMLPITLFACPADDIALSGSIFVHAASFQRLFGNGVFELFLSNLRSLYGKRI